MRSLVVWWCLFGTMAVVQADQLLLVNGDRLTGKLQRFEAGQVTFKLDLGGSVVVKQDDLRTFWTSAPVRLRLKGDRLVTRRVEPGTDGLFVLAGDDEHPAEPVAVSELLEHNPKRPAWDGEILAGLNASSGNAEDRDAQVKVSARRTAGRDRFTLNGAYYLSRQRDGSNGDQVTTKDQWQMDGKYDYFFSPQWSWFIKSRLQGDRLTELNVRSLSTTGTSYQLPHNNDFNFSANWGLTYRFEDHAYERSTDEIASQLAYGLDKRISRRFLFLHDLEWFPSLEQPGDFLLNTSASMRMYVTRATFASLGVKMEYDSTPAAQSEAIDVKYLFGLGYSF